MCAIVMNEAIDELAARFRGDLVLPESPDYDEVRRIYNGMIDRRPAIIARCTDAGDVIAAVNYAREHELPLSVRGGGHHGAGLSMCDDGLVVDLSLMKGVRVDPGHRTALVLPGCTLGDVDHATHAFGLATPTGIMSTTGMAGLTLGGGTGHLTRRYGLTIDNLISADMVLADGSFVTASESEHPDLFWAIRGGGGNFGVVTAFQFRLHPVHTVYAGPMCWDVEKADEILRWYREFLPAQEDELGGAFTFRVIPARAPFPEEHWGRPVAIIIWCHTGAKERAEAAFAPIREMFGPPLIDLVRPMALPELQAMSDAMYPPGLQWYWKADFFDDLPDEAIARTVEFGSNLATPLSIAQIAPIDGAAGRVANDATAWSWRDAIWTLVIVGVSEDPADMGRITQWTRDYWEAVHPWSAGGAYVNMMMDEGQERVRAAYRGNYDRLAAIKARYDPNNLFRLNQNIHPRTGTA